MVDSKQRSLGAVSAYDNVDKLAMIAHRVVNIWLLLGSERMKNKTKKMEKTKVAASALGHD